MSREREIRKQLAKLNAQSSALHDQLDAALRRRRIKCQGPGKGFHAGCGKRTSVSKLTYIQTHFYVSPYGCTGGDYWRPGEGKFECLHCGYVNRLYDRPDVVELKPYFGEVINIHDRRV